MNDQNSKKFHFSLPAVSGGQVSLQDFTQQKGLVVIFTCNHCPYAIAYEDRIRALDLKYKASGVPVVAISSNDAVQYPQDSFEHMRERAESKGFSFPYLYDKSQEVAHRYAASRTPHAFLLKNTGSDFELIYQGAIDDNYKKPAEVKEHFLAEAIDSLLAGQPVPTSETPAIGCTIKWKK